MMRMTINRCNEARDTGWPLGNGQLVAAFGGGAELVLELSLGSNCPAEMLMHKLRLN